MQKAHYNKTTDSWYRQFTCDDELCMYRNGGKKKRHTASAKKKKDLTANLEFQVKQKLHEKLQPKQTGLQKIMNYGKREISEKNPNLLMLADEVIADVVAKSTPDNPTHNLATNHLNVKHNYLMKRDDRDNSKYYFKLADKSIIGSLSSQNLIDW